MTMKTPNVRAREILELDVEFDSDVPAFDAEFLSTNMRVAVTDFSFTPFSAKLTLEHVGEIDESSTDIAAFVEIVGGKAGDTEEGLFVFGRSPTPGKEQKVERSIVGPYGKDKVIEFDSQWIQNKETAERLADFVEFRHQYNKLKLDIDMFGHPLIEVADIITILHTHNSITADMRFLVTSVRQQWEDGLKTKITCEQM